jgi:Ca-activated chloride channel family protein
MHSAAALALLLCLAPEQPGQSSPATSGQERRLKPAPQEPSSTIRVDVRLVNILATVRDAGGRLVPHLRRQDFMIFEDGRPQEVRVFDRQAGTPLAIALVIDASLSTAKDLRFEQDSALRFFRNLVRSQDRVSLFSFSHEVRQIADFTADFARLEKAIRGIRPEGGTSLYDAVFLAAGELTRQEGRRVMVLVTDGGDTTSRTAYHKALRAAQFADAVVYAVTVVPIPSEAGRNIGGEHTLINLADGTGGRAFVPRVASDLDSVFAELADELRTQYVLGFYPQARRGAQAFRKLEVRVTHPSFTVQARKGYYFEE